MLDSATAAWGAQAESKMMNASLTMTHRKVWPRVVEAIDRFAAALTRKPESDGCVVAIADREQAVA